MRLRRTPGRSGFTLVELLVALAVMALLAVLSWRGLDGMTRAQAQTRDFTDQVMTLQAGLAQWTADLDAVTPAPGVGGIDYDGRVLRIVRRSGVDLGEGLFVVAWTRRAVEGGGRWLRWQSPPLTTRGDLQQAWQKAARWAQNPSDEDKRREVAVAPLDEWQIFFYRSDAWTHPLSSDAIATGAPTAAAPLSGQPAVPDGVRAVLTFPPGRAVSGRITRDWVRPTVGGGKS